MKAIVTLNKSKKSSPPFNRGDLMARPSSPTRVVMVCTHSGVRIVPGYFLGVWMADGDDAPGTATPMFLKSEFELFDGTLTFEQSKL